MSYRMRVSFLLLVGLAACVGIFLWYRLTSHQDVKTAYGITFSTQYAEELGLDWKETYLATLDDLGVRKFRIPVYWNRVEKKPGVFDWTEVDWMLEQAAARGADIILAVGRKTPRWPECHVPDWAAALAPASQDQRVLRFLAQEIEHFKNAPAVKMWQVENEPLFPFGKCPPPDRDFLKEEIALVRAADRRPVMVTDSGELSTWIRTGSLADVLGISMYRLVWNKYLGELYWPVSPLYYTDRMNLISPVVKRVIVSELQAEPWFQKAVAETPLKEQFEQMNGARLLENARFAASTGASEVYLWGAEWWYWLKRQGQSGVWTSARTLFQ